MLSNSNSKIVPLREDDGRRDRGEAVPNQAVVAAFVEIAPRPFPTAPTLPHLPAVIADEILDYYGWLFCQGGFRNLKMTFEQFLTVVATVRPALLRPASDCEDA